MDVVESQGQFSQNEDLFASCSDPRQQDAAMKYGNTSQQGAAMKYGNTSQQDAPMKYGNTSQQGAAMKHSKTMDRIFKPSHQRYLKQFLSAEIKEIERRSHMHDCEIIFTEEEIQIKSNSKNDVENKVPLALEELASRIKEKTEQVIYPGVSEFLQSPSGEAAVSAVSERHGCLISVVTDNDNDTSMSKLPSVVMLGHASSVNFRFFILQCQPRDVDVPVVVEFIKSPPGVECVVKENGSRDIQILLPSWSDARHIKEQKKSLKNKLCEICEQVKYLKETRVALSFPSHDEGGIREGAIPFPVSIVAKTLAEVLRDRKQRAETKLEIFLCEPGNEAVVRTFKFYFTSFLDIPQSDVWMDITLGERHIYPKYSETKGVLVKIVSDCPSQKDKLNTRPMVCNPIGVSEEGKVFNGHVSAQSIMLRVEKEIFPDPELHQYNKSSSHQAHQLGPLFVFTISQTWGFDIEKVCSVFYFKQDLKVANYIQKNESYGRKVHHYFDGHKVFKCIDSRKET